MRADDALQQAKLYTRKTVLGMGAIKGQDGFSPTIEVTETEVGQIVTVEDKNGVENFVILDGEDGLSVANMTIDAGNHLICTMSDGSTIDAGAIPINMAEVEAAIQEQIKDNVTDNMADVSDIDSLW